MVRYTQTMTDKATNWPLIQRFFDLVVTFWNELRADSNTLNDYVARMQDRDGVIGGAHVLSVGAGADSTKVLMTGPVRYRIDGVEYTAETQVTVLQTGEITGSKWGAWRFMVGKTGVVTNQRATADGTSGEVVTERVAIAA
ncbi:MAG TPA: hypothetical protein ENI27_02945 [bacterium]|nr:hypothetical protein [bacterium]